MKRMFSRCLAIIYGLTNVFCVYAGETNYWEERRQAVQRRSSPNRLASFHVPRSAELVATGPISSLGTQQPGQPMPASHRTLLPGMEKDWGWLPELVAPYGEIREIHVASRSGAPVVFHLQDVHEVEEAQKNLAGLLESFQKQRGISLVGLEGAVGSFGLDFFREGPLESRKKLSDHFLELGYLTGPEVAGIVAETIPTLWGIEDLSLYRGHVEAFEQSEAGRTQARQFLTALSNEADRARETIYSPALMALDDHRRAYLSHRESLGDYVPALWSALKSNKKVYPQVALLVKLLAQERTLDFKEVERQRVRLAEVLAQRLAPGDLDRLVKASLAYRSGRQTAGAYQKHLATVCRQNNIRLDTFGPLAVYMDYVQGADPLDAGKLLDELDRLELVALTGTAKTNEEKMLVEVFRGLALLDKLTNHGLTPQEWGLMKKDDHSLENVRSILAKISPTLVSKTVSLPDLSPYMEFCKKAEQRNGALVKNLLAKMKADKVNTTVLVAGGFHTDGLTALLKEANASYVVITPKISKVPDTRPLDIFVRAPLPLDKLLTGDVIHLAYPRLAQKQGTLNETPSALHRQLTLKDAWDKLMRSIAQKPPPQKPLGSVVKSLIMGAIISLMSSGFVGHIKPSIAEELTNPINNSEEVAGAVSFSANPNSEDEEARLRGIVDQHLPVIPGAPTERDAVNNIAATLDDALSLDPSLAVELAKRVVLSQVPNLWLAHYSKLVLMMGKSAEGAPAETRELVDLAEVMLNEFPGPSAGVSAMDAWVLVLDVFERLLPNLSNESQREGFIALYELAHRIGEKGLMVNDPAIPLINRIEGGWMTLENAREIAAKADVPKWMRVIADRLIAQSEEDTENAVQNEDLSSPALVYLNNRKSPNKADLWRNVRDWAREILLGTEGTLENRVFKLNPMEAYVLMDVLSRPDPTMLVDSQLAAQVRAQLWVKMMAGLKAEFDQGVDRDGESPYGPLTLLAFFGDGFGQKAFFDYAIESGKGNKFFRMVPANLQGHVSAVARKVSPTISASPLGLLPLIGRPIYNFLISNGVNRRLAAGIAGVVEQGVLVLMASGLAWLLNWIFGIGFIWGLILTTAIIWKMFPKSHGSQVFVYDKFSALSGWNLKLVNVTDDHIRSLRWASNIFFGVFLVVTLIPIVIPLLGIAVPGSLDQWFFAGATISSLFHGLRNSFNPVPGKVAAMGSISETKQPYDPNQPISWGHGSEHTGSAVVIGDADASFDAVKQILRSERLVDENDRWVGGRRVVVQVGDVVGRGPQPKELYEYLINIQAQARQAGGNLVLLLGNHEMALLIGQPIGGDFKESDSVVRDELRKLLAQWVKGGNIQCAAVLSDPKEKKYFVTHAGYSIKLKELLPVLPVWEDWLESEPPSTSGTAPQDDVLIVQKFLNQAAVKIAEEVINNSSAEMMKIFRQYLNWSNGVLLGSEGVLNRVAKFVDDGFVPVRQIIGHSVTSLVRFQDKDNHVINTDSGLYRPDFQQGRFPMYLRLTGSGAVRATEIGRLGERRSYRLTMGYDRPRPLNVWGWAAEIKDWMTLKLFPIYWLRLHIDHASTLEEMLASYHRFYVVLGRGRLPWHRRSRPEQWLESHRLVVNKLWDDRASWRFVQLDGGENDLVAIASNEDRFDDLLNRAQSVWKTIPGVVKGEVLPAFLASRNYQLNPVQKEEKGQLDLELNHSPVAVAIKETGFLGVHEILIVTDIDRTGLLAEMTGAIAAQGFSVLVGDVRVEGGVVLGRFDVGGLSMDATERTEQRLSLEKDLTELILGKIGVSDLFKRNGRRYEFGLTPGLGKPPSVVGFQDGNLTVLTPDRDQPGLLHIIARKLADLDCNISLAPHSIRTQGDTVYDFFKVVESNGDPLSPQRKIVVKTELEALLQMETITEDDFKTDENLFSNRVTSELDRTIGFEDFGRVNWALLGGEAGPLDVGRLTTNVDEIRTLVQNNRLQARLARELLEREMGEWELRGEDGQLSKQSVLQAGRSLGQAIRHRERGWENPLVQARQMTLAALVSLGETLAGEPEEKWAEWAASFAQGFNEDLYEVDEIILSSLSNRRQIVLEVSETMLAGKPTEEELSKLQEWAVLMAHLDDMSGRALHWILPSASSNMKNLEEAYPNLDRLFSHRATVFIKEQFRTEQGRYSVKNFLLASQNKSRVEDLDSADLYLSTRDEWILESDLPKDAVRILISLVGGLIYDATESVSDALKRLYRLRIHA